MAGVFTVKAKQGLLIRAEISLASKEVTTIETGATVLCAEEEKTHEGKMRVRLTAPVEGWASSKLLTRVSMLGARATSATPWLRKLIAPPTAKKRLVHFNWTGNRGGYGSSHNLKYWPAALGAEWEIWEVQMPGRGARMKEPLIESPEQLFDIVAAALDAALVGGKPWVALGFSFGAIIAAEVAKRAKLAPPSLLVSVSAEAPSWGGRGKTNMRSLAPEAFEALLSEKKGTEFILQSEDMKKMYLPTIKADIVLEETYSPSAGLVPCAVVAYVGDVPGHDHEKTLIAPADVAGWIEASAMPSESRVVVLEGSEWYALKEQEACTTIITDLAKAGAAIA